MTEKDQNKKSLELREPNSTNITQVSGSLTTDSSLSNQPENTNRFALNAVSETEEGDLGFTSNEKGNKLYVALPETYNHFIITGHINLLNNEVILFLVYGPTSIIAKQTEDGKLIILIRSDCLGFLSTKHIKGKWRILNGCETVIYFVDGFNTDKAINLARLTNYTQIDVNNNLPFTAEYANDNDLWNCNLMKLESDYTHPCINLKKVNVSGGKLRLGMYQFAIQYADESQNLTNFTYISDNIPITNFKKEGPSSEDYYQIEGGVASLAPITNNSITINISDLDDRYPYFNLAVIETIEGISIPYRIEKMSTNNNLITYTYRGTNINSIPILMSELTINKVTYESSESLEIAENRLIRANLKEKLIKWDLFQKKANNIRSKYFTKPIWWGKGDRYTGSKDASVYFDNKSYMRDEVYAFGVIWVFKDGTESPSFHIPGREKNKFSNGTLIPNTESNTYHNRFLVLGPAGSWDSAIFADPHDRTSLTNNEERWQVYNTAVRNWPSFAIDGNINSLDSNAGSEDTANNPLNDFTRGELAFFESEIDYPNDMCNGIRVYPEGKIRYHKMPDTTLEPHFKTVQQSGGIYGNYNDQYILQLGIDFSNIIPPQEYANELQGYYIVRSTRSDSNKTVVDKGLLFHNVKHHYDFFNTNRVNQTFKYNKINFTAPNQFFEEQNTAEPYAFHTQTCLANRHWWADKPEGSSEGDLMNFPLLDGNRLWGASDGKVALSNFSENDSEEKMTQYYDVHNISFHSPKSKFAPESLNGSYLKLETKLAGKYVGRRAQRNDAGGKKRMTHQVVDYIWMDNGKDYKTNYLISNSFNVDPHVSITNNAINFVNKQQQETYVIETAIDNPVPHFDRSEERTIEYSQEGDNDLDGQPLDNNSTCIYAALKIENPRIYGNIYDINYIKASKCIETGITNRTFGGDIFITKFAFLKNYTTFQLHDRNDETLWKQLPYYFVESEINTELRHEFRNIDDQFPSDTYVPKETSNNYLIFWDFFKWTLETWDFANGADVQIVIDEYKANNYVKNYYAYNLDYSRENIVKFYFPLPLGYNFCSSCNNTYPHRLIYSQLGYQEQSIDFFKNFLTESYEDIEGNSGHITDIWTINDIFYIHTEQSLLGRNLQTQELETTDGNSISLGASTIFSNPLKKINSVPTGFAGNQHKQALAITEAGVFFPDAKAGKVFLYTDKLSEISDNGERAFFEEKLPIKFLDQFYSITGTKYPFEGTTSNLSVGLQSSFDTRHKRWILTKKDYNILNTDSFRYFEIEDLQDILQGDLVVPFTLFYVKRTQSFGYVGASLNDYEEVYLTDIRFFENLSWTKSYCSLIGGWKSYHSYLPNYIYNTQSKLFSFVENDFNIWEHNVGNFQEFYNVKYPFIVETVAKLNQLSTYTFPSIAFLANVLEFDSINKEWKEIDFDTFNKGIFYSSNQSTGLINLVIKNNNNPFVSVVNTPGSILINKAEKNWNINNIRNNVIDSTQSMFTKDWAILQNSYFIDKMVNNNVIDFSKALFTTDKIRDKFMSCRFIYDNPENRKFNFKYIIDKSKTSYR